MDGNVVMAWLRRPSTGGNGDRKGEALMPRPETLQEIEEVISRIITSLAGSKRAKSTAMKYQYVMGSRMSEVFIENPDEFREMLYRDYGQLSDEIIEKIVETLAEIAQSEERPPSMDSKDFKEYVVRLAEKLEKRLESISYDVTNRQNSKRYEQS